MSNSTETQRCNKHGYVHIGECSRKRDGLVRKQVVNDLNLLSRSVYINEYDKALINEELKSIARALHVENFDCIYDFCPNNSIVRVYINCTSEVQKEQIIQTIINKQLPATSIQEFALFPHVFYFCMLDLRNDYIFCLDPQRKYRVRYMLMNLEKFIAESLEYTYMYVYLSINSTRFDRITFYNYFMINKYKNLINFQCEKIWTSTKNCSVLSLQSTCVKSLIHNVTNGSFYNGQKKMNKKRKIE